MNIDKALKADIDKNMRFYEEFGFKVVSKYPYYMILKLSNRVLTSYNPWLSGTGDLYKIFTV